MPLTTVIPVSTVWKPMEKFVFCFTFLYFLLYTFPFPLSMVPGIDTIMYETVEKMWDAVIPWVGENVVNVGYEITVKPGGSGDTTWNYVQIFLIFVLALFGAIIWAVVDRKRPNYEKLYYWSIVAIRYYLAFMLLSYGFAKIFKSQFPFPGLSSLEQPFGETSPMGLAWNFIGYSTGFNLFTGIGEALGGFLLFFRRTRLLGALVSFVVMLNIVVMNFCYDIPVKLFSANLMIMIIFILTVDFKRLINFLVLNKPTAAANNQSPFSDPIIRKIIIGLKILIIGYVLYSNVSGYFGPQEYGDRAPNPPLYGIYDVQSFSINNKILPPLTTDSVRWKQLIVDWPGSSTIKVMDESKQYFAFEPDTTGQTISMYAYRDSSNINSILNYTKPHPDSLIINGIWQNDTLSIEFSRRDEHDFRLVKRGFHWINEYPFNR